MPINPATQMKWANYLKGKVTQKKKKEWITAVSFVSTKESKFVE